MSRPRQVSLVGRVVATGSVVGPLSKRKAAAVQIVVGAEEPKSASFPLAVTATAWRGTSIFIKTSRGVVRVPLAEAKLLFAGGEMDRPRRLDARRRDAVPDLDVPQTEGLWILERPIPPGARVHLLATLTLDPSAAADASNSATWVARPSLGPIVLTIVNDRSGAAHASRGWVAALAVVAVAAIGATVWLLQAG